MKSNVRCRLIRWLRGLALTLGVSGLSFAHPTFADEANTNGMFGNDEYSNRAATAREKLPMEVERLYQRQEYLAIVELVFRITKHEPMPAQVWLRIGNSLDHLERYEEALTAYREAQAVALPAPSQHGYLQAKLVRSKALLNIAQILHRLSKQALGEFQAIAMPVAEQNGLLASAASHTRAIAHALSRPQLGLDRARPAAVGGVAQTIEPNAKAADTTPVIIEYRRGAVRLRQ